MLTDKKLIKLNEEKEYFLDFNGALFSIAYNPDNNELTLRGYKQDKDGFEMLFEEVIDVTGT